MAVQNIPEGFHSVTPYLAVKDARAAIDFYRAAFDAELMYQMEIPGGGIAHAEIRIGNSMMMLADENPEMNHLAPQSLGGSAVSMMIYVADCDAVHAQAIAAGAEQVSEVQDQFYGDRSGQIIDPFGHRWTIGTHVEDVSPEELDRRAQELFGT